MIGRRTLRAGAFDVAIGKKSPRFFVIEQFERLLLDVTVLFEFAVDFVTPNAILDAVRRVVTIKVDVKGFEVAGMFLRILCNEGLGRDTGLRRVDFDRGSVRVVGADVNRILAGES